MSALTFPTLDEYEEVAQQLQAAHDAVEQMLWRLRDALEPAFEGPAPTIADVGATWVFVDRLENRADDFERFAQEADRYLGQLDSARIDRPLQEAVRS